MRHELKCWAEYFDAIYDGRKTFEVRKNDRGFKVGDVLELNRWDPDAGAYTGEVIERQVTYVLEGPGFGISEGTVVLALAYTRS